MQPQRFSVEVSRSLAELYYMTLADVGGWARAELQRQVEDAGLEWGDGWLELTRSECRQYVVIEWVPK